MRNTLILASLMLCTAASVAVEADVRIGINLALYPNLVAVPGYPVYYAPDMDSNYFFYDGRYWVYTEDSWYASSWYNGPWEFVDPELVPLYVLRVPVRYYRQPPLYFRSWSAYSSPRWDEHWGNEWSQHHRDWDHWDHHEVPVAAPLPVYQKQYSGDRYPEAERQLQLQKTYYQRDPQRAPVQRVDPPIRRHNQPAAARTVSAPLPDNKSGVRATQPEQHRDQRDSPINPVHQPDAKVPRVTSPAPQVQLSPRQPPRQPAPQPSPEPNPAARTRARQPEQHATEVRAPTPPRVQDTQAREHNQQPNEQSRRRKDND